MKARGFTLVELVMVIMITGIIAASLTIFLKPAIDSYFDTRRRADLTDMADTALRRMSQDIRSAVPNSVRWVSATCFQMVPTITGGRYRMAPDTVAGGSAYIDTSIATSAFDVLSPMATTPAKDDWIVIGNQNSGDVYTGTNRGAVNTVTTPATGLHRINLTTATQFPVGYEGGRFVVVPNAETTITYTCANNRLYRKTTTNTFPAANCSAGADNQTVATDVESCTFVYDPNQGATQQSGFVWMRIELKRSGESAALAHGVHVSNAP